MTYSTCWIEVLKNAELPRVPDTRASPEDFVPSLPTPPRGDHYWVATLGDWARAHGHHVDHVDNTSIVVGLSADDLTEFIRVTYGFGDPYGEALTARLSMTNRYKVHAEEF